MKTKQWHEVWEGKMSFDLHLKMLNIYFICVKWMLNFKKPNDFNEMFWWNIFCRVSTAGQGRKVPYISEEYIWYQKCNNYKPYYKNPKCKMSLYFFESLSSNEMFCMTKNHRSVVMNDNGLIILLIPIATIQNVNKQATNVLPLK